jgi:hypothetical protein
MPGRERLQAALRVTRSRGAEQHAALPARVAVGAQRSVATQGWAEVVPALVAVPQPPQQASIPARK